MQMLQQEPQSEEEAMQQQQIQQQLPAIEEQLNFARKTLEKELIISGKDIEKTSRYYAYEYHDWVEDIGQKLMRMIKNKFGVERASLKNFVSQVVTGKQAYYVDLHPGDRKITFESIDTIKVFYPITESIEWIQDGEWVMIEDFISLSQATDRYQLSEEELEKIATNTHDERYSVGDFFGSSAGENIMGSSVYSGTQGSEDGITERKIWWRGKKKVQCKQSPNPHEDGEYFTHFLDDEGKVIDNGQMYYDKKIRKYVDKKTGSEYDKKDVISGTKGEKLQVRYVDEIYHGVVLGGCVIKNAGKKPLRIYSNESFSWTVLPVIGKTYNDITERPYSLIWDTKDIQKMYNILNYHKELLLATSGVKGTIMDMSQKPEGMSKQEWMYMKKLGTMWIETVKKGGRTASYNQFGSYDDTVSPGIQYIDNMMMMLDESMGNIIGVGRQRQGQVQRQDQVATYQMAIEQNSLITEIIYAEHDEIQRRAMEVALNLASKYLYKDGGMFEYQSENLRMERFKIPADVLNKLDLRLNVANNLLEEQKLKEIKQFAVGQMQSDRISIGDLIKLYNTDTLQELESKFNAISERAMKVAQENQMQAIEADKQSKVEMEQIKGEIEMQQQQLVAQLKQMELDLKGSIEQGKAQLEKEKISLDEKKHMDEMQLKLLDLKSEREIEGAYLEEETRSNQVDEQLRAIEIELNALQERANARTKAKEGKGQKKERIRD